jgi:hypothetical protein
VAKVALRRSLGKDADGPVSRWLNRPLSTRLSMLLAPLRPSPDLVSLVAFGFGLAGAVLLAVGQGLAASSPGLGSGPWTGPPEGVLVLTVAATTGALLSMASKDRAAALGLPPAPERALGWLLGGRDGRLLLVTVGAVLDAPVVALAAVTATSGLSLAFRVAFLRRQPAPDGAS